MNINLQLLITAVLGVTLLSMVYMHYDEELILALITGLVGVLVPIKTTNTNNDITTQEAIQKLKTDPNIIIQEEYQDDTKEDYS